MSIRIVIAGARGRMGQMLTACAGRRPGMELVGQVDVGDALEDCIGRADVVVDFSLPAATLGIVRLCAEHRKGLVLGTTGHGEEERAAIASVAAPIPMVWTSNYSMGVNALFWLTRKAAEILGPSFDLEVVEMHHRMKKDAPSGTARTLAEVLASVRGQQLAEVVRHGREGITGERTATEIGVHSLRGGDVVGDHMVVFAALGERVELSHRASSRETFAEGALRAAEWVIRQPPGQYDMQDVLGLR
jgi:4-hydroxy-tetrahydrodipicolinate reductase